MLARTRTEAHGGQGQHISQLWDTVTGVAPFPSADTWFQGNTIRAGAAGLHVIGAVQLLMPGVFKAEVNLPRNDSTWLRRGMLELGATADFMGGLPPFAQGQAQNC